MDKNTRAPRCIFLPIRREETRAEGEKQGDAGRPQETPGAAAPSITIIHATRAAVAPVEETFERLWPEAEIFSVLDEFLSREMDRLGEMTPAVFERIERLARFGKEGGAAAILYSCSAFGEAIEAVKSKIDIPVLKPNEAMLEEALETGGKIRLAATFEPSIPSIQKELSEMAASRGQTVETESCFVPGAFDALLAGDGEKHDALIADALAGLDPCDSILLAQFSMARALPAVVYQVDARVLTSPDSAVRKLQRVLREVAASSKKNARKLGIAS